MAQNCKDYEGRNFYRSPAYTLLERPLKRLARLLGEQFMSARQIADRTGCSRVQAYRRVAALRTAGITIAEKKTRQGKTGPLARAFKVER